MPTGTNPYRIAAATLEVPPSPAIGGGAGDLHRGVDPVIPPG